MGVEATREAIEGLRIEAAGAIESIGESAEPLGRLAERLAVRTA